jgi:hypothetical protein
MTVREQTELSRPTFMLKIEYGGKPEFATHALRRLLKSLIHTYRFRVRSIEEIDDREAAR